MTINHPTKSNPPWAKLAEGILNEIVPASFSGVIPSAGSSDVVHYLASVCAEDSDLSELFSTGFSRANTLLETMRKSFDELDSDERVSLVQRLEAQNPAFFAALLRYTYMGYYSRSEVRQALGLSKWPVHPRGYEVQREPLELMESLTAPVKARGAFYRAG